jgi:hypothetical protein
MKLSKSNNNHRHVYIIVAIVFLAIGGLVGAYVVNKMAGDNTQKTSENSQTTTQEDQNTAKGSSGSKPTQTTDSIPVSNSLSSKITTLEQDGENIKFQGVVNNTHNIGNCVVTFENPNDKPVVRSFDSTEKDGSQICGEISIPSLEFSYLGTWNVTFRFIVDGSQTTANDKIDIR